MVDWDERVAAPFRAVTRRGQPVDGVDQPLGCIFRQIRHQPLGQPPGRPGRVETGSRERGGPVVAQVGRHRVPLALRPRAKPGEHPVLELQHTRQVYLEDHGVGRPVQPERAAVQPGRDDDELPHAGAPTVGVVVVEEPGTQGHRHRHLGPQPVTRRYRVDSRGHRLRRVRGLDERRGERISGKWFRTAGLDRSRSRHGERGDTHTGDDVPVPQFFGHLQLTSDSE